MKKTVKNYKNIKKECNLCMANFNAWLSTLNYDKDKEEAVQSRLYNYCPVCLVSEKTGHKSRL
ncbi:MAG: hypothetical protein WCZ99_01950 [Candidatus Paceibacterota bacterium]|nr:hypothetical protein [Candidatus Paceibacterota bacterium]MDD3072466.1 hypothetical protein [Candidatus Paceibacterota bacterium]